MNRLDIYEDLPQGQRKYLQNYGWHFSKALAEDAVSRMRDRNGAHIKPLGKEEVEDLLLKAGVELKNDELYDKVYVANMAVADYYGSSITDMAHVALFVKDYLDDPDGSPTRALDEYCGRCIGSGRAIQWADMI